MGLSYKKSKNLGNGTKLNIGKSSIGMSAGVKGARISANTKGHVRMNFSIPGTGFRYTRTISKSGGAVAMLTIGTINIMIYICKIIFIFMWWLLKITFVCMYYIFYYVAIGCKTLLQCIKNKASERRGKE